MLWPYPTLDPRGKAMPMDQGSVEAGAVGLQLMLCPTGIRHYRRYLYIDKKEQYNRKEQNTTSTA